MSLNNQSISFNILGRRKDTVIALEGVKLYRELAVRLPVAYEQELADALRWLSDLFRHEGRQDETE